MIAARIWRRPLGVALVLLTVLVGVLWFAPSDHYLFLPDAAQPVEQFLVLPDEEETPDGAQLDGGIYMVDILVRRANLLDRIFPGIHDGSTLVPQEVFNPHGVSDEQRREQSLAAMSRSQQVAIAVALESLGYDVRPGGAEIVRVEETYPAAGTLEVGDVVLEIGGESVETPDELVAAMRGHEPGEPIAVTIRRGGGVRTVEVGTRESPNDAGRAIMGIVVQPELELPVDVEIDAGSIGGPSAGLAFALGLVDQLGDDVDAGRRIAVTGTLDLDGRVGEIGGIKQKTIGAREAGADLFLVPAGNADEARRYAEGLEIVAVSSFGEALSQLDTG